MSGWAALGEILGGGVKRQAEDEYAPQMQRNGSAFKILEEARMARARNMAREAITDEQIMAAGYSKDSAPFIRNALLTGQEVDLRRLGDAINPNYLPAQAEIGRTMGIGRDPLLGETVPAIDNAGRQRIADLQVAISDKPVQRNEVRDGVAFDPYTIGDTGSPTAIGKERMALLGAQALASGALAGQRNATAAKTRDQTTNPGKYRAPAKESKGKPSKATMRWNPTTKKLEPIK